MTDPTLGTTIDEMELDPAFLPLAGADAIDAARVHFAAELDLPLPAIPRAFLDGFVSLGSGIYGTRADTPNLYDLPWFLDELAAGPPEDYCLFGLAGHGTRSWAMHCYMIRRPVAFFVQIPFGGAYDTGPATRREIARSFLLMQTLMAIGGSALDGSKDWLVCVQSQLVPSGWARLPLPDENLMDGLTLDRAPFIGALKGLNEAYAEATRQ